MPQSNEQYNHILKKLNKEKSFNAIVLLIALRDQAGPSRRVDRFCGDDRHGSAKVRNLNNQTLVGVSFIARMY